MLEITDRHVEIFKQIKDRFLSETDVPEQDSWKSWTNDKIWIESVIQVIAVGGSEPADKFKKDKQRQDQVSYEKLIQIEDEVELKAKIHQVLRAVSTRYVGDDVSKSRKTNALFYL